MKRFYLLLMFLLPAALSAQTVGWSQLRRGNRAYRNGNYDAAVRHYVAARNDTVVAALADYGLGLAYIGKKDLDGAAKQFAEAQRGEKDPRVRSMAAFNRGYVLQRQASDSLKQGNEQGQQRKLREAIEEYKNALRRNPSDDQARYNLALCQKQLKESRQQKQQSGDKNEEKEDNDKQKQPKDNQKPDNQEEKANPQPPQRRQEEDRQAQQLLNLSRQAEQRTRQKVNEALPRPRELEHNW